jgi:hypothetical protein
MTARARMRDLIQSGSLLSLYWLRVNNLREGKEVFGSIILDTAIGLVLVYLFLSLICMTINEGIAAAFSIRANTLKKALISMIDDKDMVERIYNNPVIFGLWQSASNKREAPLSSASTAVSEVAATSSEPKQSGSYSSMLRPPSYLPPKQVAIAVLDILKTEKNAAIKGIEEIDNAVKALPPGPFKDALQSMVSRVGGDVERFRASLEEWFDDGMDRVTGWYKRRMQLIGVGVAMGVTVICNADTLQIVSGLYHDSAMRGTVTATAVEYVKTANQVALGDIPIGWAYAHAFPESTLLGWGGKIVGWLITAVALTLGAPFWFDMLNKFINIRLAGKKPGEESNKRSAAQGA